MGRVIAVTSTAVQNSDYQPFSDIQIYENKHETSVILIVRETPDK